MSLLRAASILVCSIALAAGAAAAPAQAGVGGPAPVDPVIEVLPAVPVPYRPYTGPVCTDGDPACIEKAIAEMEAGSPRWPRPATTTRSSRWPTCG